MFVSVCFLVLGVGRAAEPQKLNVLLIISDDLRTELGCYPPSSAKTPHIDTLAAAGVRFDRSYCQFPLCNPSRSSMLNGRYPKTTGILGNRAYFRDAHPDYVTLPQLFKQNGYASLRTGKIFHGGIDDEASWTEGGEARGTTPNPVPADPRSKSSLPPPRGQGRPAQGSLSSERQMTQAERSDRWIVLGGDGSGNGENEVADRAIEYLRRYKDKPFFLACGFSKPHSPLTAPMRFYDLYDTDRINLPPDYAPKPTVWAGFPLLSIRPRNADLFIGRDSTPQTAREMIRAYWASVSWMDWNTGRVIAELDKLGLREKTIIVFWGDNGYQLGEKGKWSKAGSVWEEGARIPLIIVAPGARGNGRMSPRIVQSIDIYPTLAELCRLALPDGLEGRSLAPLLDDPGKEWNQPAYTIWSEDGRNLTAVAVRNERWRYAEFGPQGEVGAMLLDMINDPHQMKNLAGDPQHTLLKTELEMLVKNFREKRR
jgi:arylsulfatase A-like enzyme